VGGEVSDNVPSDESEPAVLFTAGQHAREHLTIEMALYLLHELADRDVLNVRGAATDRDAVWTGATLNLDAFAGQTIRIVVEAADAGTTSLVEAAVETCAPAAFESVDHRVARANSQPSAPAGAAPALPR
jgi:hypothetical protein